MTDEELRAIRDREARALQGPWEWGLGANETDVLFWTPDDKRHASSMGIVADPAYADGSSMDFIAHARTDIPALLAEIDRLKAANVELSKAWGNESAKRSEKPDFDLFIDPQFGPFNQILTLLQEGQISRGDAAEAVA